MATRLEVNRTISSEDFDQLLNDIKADFQERSTKERRQHPYKAIQLLKEYQIPSIQIPSGKQGKGASLEELFTAVIKIAEADPDVAHILRAHFMTVHSLLEAPPTRLRERLLKEIQNGAIIGNAYTENSKHKAGDRQYDTTLRKEGEQYILYGEKYFTTGTYYADYTFVTAMLDDDDVNVVIPVTREGVKVLDDWDGIGQQLTGSGTTIFDHVSVDADEIFIQQENTYAPLPHLYLQAIIAGILKNVVTDAIQLIHTRKRSFSHGNTEDLKKDVQLQQVVGQLSSFSFAAEAMVLDAARSLDEASLDKTDPTKEHTAALKGSQAKVAIEELAFKAATLLFEVGGASATKQSANLDRHWRNIRTLASHNPTLYKARAIGNYFINGERLPTPYF
ncbi:alkylation response protein AidB-like acyl-CoA dehydrogenase [Gracilibacillus halotolerans]|uniref:Dibenzothiophene monooxygenase n=1 Tax=Gracilibacillus halotolerans TaxID=74386 RepID=A0A841RQ48_9BACI|nr:acyl-CoA dehydrogenase [Gracilibacillus halotolerans]MBB6513496.1 alkylation response protein AidB-like acyl-CoA dehydrogenase [Gracilibacillus halotolerans]